VSTFTDPGISTPAGIAAGPDGALWFTNNSGNSIGRITTGGVVSSYTDASVGAPYPITAGPDGALWFLNGGTATRCIRRTCIPGIPPSLGRITTAGAITRFPSPQFAAALGIAAGPNGSIWVAGTNSVYIGRMQAAAVDPVLSVPAGVSQQAATAAGATMAFTATAVDVHGGALTPVCVPASGTLFAPGVTPVTCTATDLEGNGASATFQVTVSVAAIDASPPAVSTSRSAPFSWSSPFITRYTYSLDSGAYAPCSSPRTYNGLASGTHTFCVMATAAVLPTCRTWTISPPPAVVTVTVVSNVPGTQSATLSFTSDQPGLPFSCRLDSLLPPSDPGGYAPCSSPRTYRSLALGSHTLEVVAIDPGNGVSSAVASATFVVAGSGITPVASISLDANVPGTQSATLSFTSDQPGSTFTCKFNAQPAFTACSSPRVYRGLALGSHTLQVQATAGGLTSAVASLTFTVS